MNGWIDSFKATGLDELVEQYRVLMMPKAGRKRDRALREIQRQRGERLAVIDRLRLEAAALFVLERELTSTNQESPAKTSL